MPGKTVLHVEDDSDEAFFVSRAFEKADLNCTLHHVSDGDTALAYLEGAAPYDQREQYPLPDAVLLDLKLPGKDGFEVLAWIREQPRLSGIPIIILTSSDRSEDLQRAKALGITAYLNKSISCRNVIDLLKSLLAV